MPFGLKSAGSTFMRAMSKILQPIRSFTEPFIDDFAVHSSNWDDHLLHLTKFFEVIERSGLTLSLNKSRFAQSKVTFLGHVISSGKITPDPLKSSLCKEIKPPLSKKDVRRLVGFFSYFRAFIPDMSQTAHVITELTKKGVPNRVPWGEEHQAALDKLFSDLNNATALNTIDYRKRFGLSTDASAVAVGCCLFQWNEEGWEVPVAFGSAKLSETQSQWSTIEREAFAVIWALNKFRSWILLSEVIVYSDHNPLTSLTNAAPKSAKLTRWALALQEYNITFEYKKGRDNVVADFMSRII